MADDTVDDLKDEIQALRDELKRLKQEKRSDAASTRSPEAVEAEMEEVADQVKDVAEESRFSRRDFMKMLGGGAAGLGAAAMLPSMASAFKVESDNALQYFNQSGTGVSSFEVTPSGNLTTQQIGTVNDKIQNIHASSVTTDQLGTTADHIVSSKSELQSAFNNLSAGDTIWIETPDTPYRTDQWLDIDVDNVSVVAQTPFADNGDAIIKIADGANVGGIRAGHNGTVTDIYITNVGVDGNRANQTSGYRHHGIWYEQVTNGVVDGCYVTKTHPKSHSDGGSGIVAYHNSQNITFKNNWVTDPGDRCIESSAKHTQLGPANVVWNGFDRGLAGDAAEGGTGSDTYDFYHARGISITNNYIYDFDQGSAIGMGSGPGFNNLNTGEDVLITENLAVGSYKRLVTVRHEVKKITVTGNAGVRDGTTDNDKPGIHLDPNYKYGVVSGNYVENFGAAGIKMVVENGTVTGNVIIDPDTNGIETPSNQVTITGNTVVGAGQHGIQYKGNHGTIGLNNIEDVQQRGLHLDSKNSVIGGNKVLSANQSSGGYADVYFVQGSVANLVYGNKLSYGGSAGFREDANGSSFRNQYIANRIGTGQANAWDILGDATGQESWTAVNVPTNLQFSSAKSVSSGGTVNFDLPYNVTGTEDVELHVKPDNDPGNDHGYNIDSVWYDTSAGTTKVRVTETESDGGGQCRLFARRKRVDY